MNCVVTYELKLSVDFNKREKGVTSFKLPYGKNYCNVILLPLRELNGATYVIYGKESAESL